MVELRRCFSPSRPSLLERVFRMTRLSRVELKIPPVLMFCFIGVITTRQIDAEKFKKLQTVPILFYPHEMSYIQFLTEKEGNGRFLVLVARRVEIG